MAKRHMKLSSISPIIWEMHIKRTGNLGYHLTPKIKKTIIQNTINKKYRRGCGEPSCILLGMFTGTATENSIQVLKKLRLELPCDAGITLGRIFLMKQNHRSKITHTPPYSWHFVDNSQDMQVTKCPPSDR